MRSPSRRRPGKLREQICGVAPFIACVAHSRNDKKLAAISARSCLSHPEKITRAHFSSKATACLNWYPKAIEN
jgi:hypothetical protein